MVPAVLRLKIPHVVQISAQSEQLCERYSKFNWFLKIACLRYVNTWGWDCVSGVPPCLVHSHNLSELTGHSYGGQIPYRTAVRSVTRERVSKPANALPETEPPSPAHCECPPSIVCTHVDCCMSRRIRAATTTG